MTGWLAGPQAWLAGPQAWLAGPQAWLDGPEGGDGQTYVQTDGKSPHSTGLRPLSRPLPKKKSLWIVTSKLFELESCETSQIIGN